MSKCIAACMSPQRVHNHYRVPLSRRRSSVWSSRRCPLMQSERRSRGCRALRRDRTIGVANRIRCPSPPDIGAARVERGISPTLTSKPSRSRFLQYSVRDHQFTRKFQARKNSPPPGRKDGALASDSLRSCDDFPASTWLHGRRADLDCVNLRFRTALSLHSRCHRSRDRLREAV